MLCLAIFCLNQLVLCNSSSEKDRKHLIIDFGGKFLKAALDNYTSDSFTYLTKNGDGSCDSPNNCYSIPNSISAAVDDMMKSNTSEEAIRIGSEALQKARKNQLLGIEFFGAIFNRKRKYISENCDFFNIDKNVTISDFPLFWYLAQFFAKYQSKTAADDLTIILPGYATDLTLEELTVTNNQTFSKLNFFKDYEIIQKVHENIFSKSGNKNVLYLDFGAFAAKATVINDKGEIASYEFCEECGIEKVAYRQASQDEKADEKTKENAKKNENSLYNGRVTKARDAAYKKLKSENFNDELFDKKLNELIAKSKSTAAFDEIILIGGGCRFPFVTKTVEKLSKSEKTSLIENITNKNLNHLTFYLDGYKFTLNGENLSSSSTKFIYHPLFVSYCGEAHKIPEFSKQSYQFKINLGKIQRNQKVNVSAVWNNHLKITTDESHVIGGMSKTVLKLEVPLNDSESFDQKYIQISGAFVEDAGNSLGLSLEAELCDVSESKEFVCDVKLPVVRSNATVVKNLAAKEKATATDAAMGLIRALFGGFSQVKNKKRSEEL